MSYSSKIFPLQDRLIRIIWSRTESREHAGKSPTSRGTKWNVTPFSPAPLKRQNATLIRVISPASTRITSATFAATEWNGAGGGWRPELENKGSWHRNRRPALHAPCCYASIYQAASLLFRLHTLFIWGAGGVQDVEGYGGDTADLFNRRRTLWAGSESISAGWSDRPFLDARPILFRSTSGPS